MLIFFVLIIFGEFKNKDFFIGYSSERINPGDFMLLESGDVATIATAIPNATVTNASSGFNQNLNAFGVKYKTPAHTVVSSTCIQLLSAAVVY